MNSKLSGGTDRGLHGSGAVQSHYVPAVDDRALELIARIRRNHADTQAVHALAEHYEGHGDLPSLANLMEGWASTLDEDRKAADAYLRAAWAVANGLGDCAREQALYERALERFPEHPTALTTLERMLHARGEHAELERVMSRTLVELAHRLVDPKLRAGIHQRLGQLYEQLGQPSAAIAQYRAALELDSSSTEVIAAARAIYHQEAKAGPVADMYELEIAATGDVVRRSELLRALAEHRRDALADLDGAILALRRALKRSPSDLTTIERLAELLRERSRSVGNAAGEADRVRAAELYFQLARNVPRREARHRLLACMRLEPEHPRAKAMLAELEAYGAALAVPLDPHFSQAELEGKATGRYATQSGDNATAAPAQALQATHEDYVAWVNDDEITEIEDDVGLERMVPITERPPAAPADPATPGSRSRPSVPRKRFSA
jgi:tetratricopeptide (TPR) repeat protein